MPRNDIVRRPSTYHQSPSSSRRTVGRRSSSLRDDHRSGGSTMWESEDTSQGVEMLTTPLR
jgi:hypothetical protein